MLELFGIGTSSHQFLRALLVDSLDAMRVNYIIKDSSDLDEFISLGIESIPAVKVNHKMLFQQKDYPDLKKMAHSITEFVNEEYKSSMNLNEQ